MDIEQIEKQFQMWDRFLWMILGSSIIFAIISPGNVFHAEEWSGFGNYVGSIWIGLQLLSTLPGLHLLLGKRWKVLPFSGRRNTTFGYFAVSWINMFSAWFIASMTPPTEYYLLLIGSAIAILLGYIWALKRTLIRKEEIFP